MPARRGNAGHHHIGIVKYRHGNAAENRPQRFGNQFPHIDAFELNQVGRVLDKPVADDSRHAQANMRGRLLQSQPFHLAHNALHNFVSGYALQRIRDGGIFRSDSEGAHRGIVRDRSRRDSFRYDDPDSMWHV